MIAITEFLSLSDVAYVHDLSRESADLEVYFLQNWTADKFFANRRGTRIVENKLQFIIMLSDGLDYTKLNRMDNPRIRLSFRKRRSDNVGFVIVSIDKKGW